MQLQAERHHFVHAGIGGSSSSSSASSPSSSPPKDASFVQVKVIGLRKPKAKTRDLVSSSNNPPSKPKTPRKAPQLDISTTTTSTINSLEQPTSNTASSPIHVGHSFIPAPPTPPTLPTEVHLEWAKLNRSEDVTMEMVLEVEPALMPEQAPLAMTLAPLADSGLCTRADPTPVSLSSWSSSLEGHMVLSRQGLEPQTWMVMDRLSRLPSELLFKILCLLDAFDLTRVSQTSRFFANTLAQGSLWRTKSLQHPLYSAHHLHGQLAQDIHWLSYYRFLHRNSLLLQQNWADALPQAIHVLEGHTGLVSSVEMSMWTLVTASIDSTLRVWDLRTLQCIRVLHSKHALTCVSQSESAGAACARTSFGGLCIWDIRTGELILQDDTAMPQIASFIYMDDTYIGYGQCDGVVTVFDWSSRKSLEVVGTYQAHDGDVIHISILNHKYVISASTNGETLVYSIARSCIVERILLPHATQAIQFTPTIHGDKVMFSTRDAIYEYELLLDQWTSTAHSAPQRVHGQNKDSHLFDNNASSMDFELNSPSAFSLTESEYPTSDPHSTEINVDRSTNAYLASQHLQPTLPSSRPAPSRVWKTSNSLLSQIRQRIAMNRRDLDQEENAMNPERPPIPTRFPHLSSVYCLPREGRSLDHGTTSARDSYGVFLPSDCTRLNEIILYTRATKQIRQIHGPAVDRHLGSAVRNRFYTTMECNQHCAVVSSGNKLYVISFLPPGI